MSDNPAKLIGQIGWVMQPGYPELSGEEGDETITERYVVAASEIGAIPLPGTGGWTGALIAALMDIRIKKSFPIIAIGVLVAGIIMSVITYLVPSFFGF